MWQNENPSEKWDREHPGCDDIPCEACHQSHIDNWDVLDNYKQKIECCVGHVESAISAGTICKKHIEWLGKLTSGEWWCDQCQETNTSYKGHPKPNNPRHP